MPLNAKLQMRNQIIKQHMQKYGGTLKEAMQSKRVKTEYQKKLKEMEKSRKISPKRKTKKKKPTRRVTSPVKKTRSRK